MNKFKLSMTALLALGMTASMCAQNGQSKKSLKVLGTTRIGNAKKVATESGNEVLTGPEVDVTTAKPQISGTTSPARVPSAHVPNPTGNALITAAGSNFVGFNGLTHRDQRLSNNGNQFSLEPPDQGLAVSGGYVVEAVNDAVAVYDRSGTLLKGPVSLNEFFNLPPAINRTTTPPTFGPDPTDPRVYYDTTTGRFFLVSLVLGLDQQENFVPPAVQYIAVSQTSDPTGMWTILALDVTDDGGPFSPCPCFGDQPLIGADANGFYISDNAYNIVARSFAGANMYAMSKSALEAASSGSVTAMRFGPLTEAGFPFAFSVQPATTAPGADNASGTEFFVSSLDFTGTVDDRLVVWALTGTDTLNSDSPALTLTSAVVNTESYGQPPQLQQEPGPFPLGTALGEHEELVASNDDRLQQVVYSGGNLWTSLTSSAKTGNGPVRAVAAYFILKPSLSGSDVSATVVNQGYVSLNNPNQDNVVFPSLAVNASGQGLMGFSVVGADFFPSAGYATIDPVSGAGPIHITAAGFEPEDGFSGYFAFGGARVGRWGDYSAAASDPSGNLWIANEYIPNAPRTVNANWGTFIGMITP